MEHVLLWLDSSGGKNKVLKTVQYLLKLGLALKAVQGGTAKRWKRVASALSAARAISTWGDSLGELHDAKALALHPSALLTPSGFHQAVDTLSDTRAWLRCMPCASPANCTGTSHSNPSD